LLDITIFLINLFLMRTMLKHFVDLLRGASEGEGFAQFAVFLLVVGIFVLPPLGATIKRWHYHRRLRLRGMKGPRDEDLAIGCLFNPIFYFCLNVVIFATINAFVMQYIYGDRDPGGGVFVSSILFGLVLIGLNTYLVYRYFSPPKTEPRARILREPHFEVVGDAAIFTNMIVFQLVWNLLSFADIGRVGSVGELIGRLFVFVFLALLIYFPPRIFYLAEDIKKTRTWLTMLLANAPIIYRFVIGTKTPLEW
jgi:hypothetical protein